MASLLAIAGAGQAIAQGVPHRGSPAGTARPSGALPAVSQPVVQPLPSSDGMTLDAALGRLARDPRDISALIDAGNAALTMGDVDAATGFFRRADQVSPGNPRVKAGLAGAMVRNGDPFGAIPLFDEAEKAGAMDTAFAADRGLAYDLVGDNVAAQKFYRQALARGPSEEVVRRLSLSLAISGDKHNAELILSPLLQNRNLAAWRTRAFVLAILGQTEEAVSIANSILPSELATGVAPYLRYMPRLTRAQQAAAANFGQFPRASEIGRDDPRVALYAPKQTAVAAADAKLTPQGEPLGRKGRGRDRNRKTATASVDAMPGVPATSRDTRLAPEPPPPTREVTASALTPAPATRLTPTPAPAPSAQVAMAPTPAPAPVSTLPPGFAPTQPVRPAAATPVPAAALPPGFAPTTEPARPAATAPTPTPAPQRSGSGMLAVSPGFSIAPAASPAPTPTPTPASSLPVARPTPPPTPAPPPPRKLADVFAEFSQPTTDATPAAGAVDLRRIKPAKKPAEPVKPPPPSHPSRIWVQIATGRDKAALGYDWRRMTRDKAEVLRGKGSFVSAWGQTNRLLTGPFPSESAANSFIAQLRRADIDGAFVWTSPAGQVVDSLGAAPAEPAAKPATRPRRGAAATETEKPRRGAAAEAARTRRSTASSERTSTRKEAESERTTDRKKRSRRR